MRVMQGHSFVILFSDLTQGETIGSGGFGIVCKGTYHGADVAIKKLHAVHNLSPEAEREFKREAEMMGQLRHPNVVGFFGYCSVPKCLVMEYMPKGSLWSVLHDQQQPLDWVIRLSIATDIALGLKYLHSQNILHRDIKSLNVLLDNDHRAKLTDFGLSRIKHETRSAVQTRQDVGTIRWMAPELFRVDVAPVYIDKCDVYSLGITFWELAARQIPYAARQQAAIPHIVQQGVRDIIPADCPPKLANLITQCCKENPAERPSAAEIANYLKSDVPIPIFAPAFGNHPLGPNQNQGLPPPPPVQQEQKGPPPAPVILSTRQRSRGSKKFYGGVALMAGVGALLVAHSYSQSGKSVANKPG